MKTTFFTLLLVLAASLMNAANYFVEIQSPESHGVDYDAGYIEVFAELDEPLTSIQRIAISTAFNNPLWVTGDVITDNLYSSMYRVQIPYLENTSYETREDWVRIDLQYYNPNMQQWDSYSGSDTYFHEHICQFGAIAVNPWQDMIDNTSDGETLIIDVGEHLGHLVLDDRHNLTISGKGFSNTVIKSAGHRSAISISNCTNIKITDLTITNGLADDGGGLYCVGSSVTIERCLIKDNSTRLMYSGLLVPPETKGGAIYLGSGICEVKSTIILDNDAELAKTAYVAGGLLKFDACTLLESTNESNYETTAGRFEIKNSIISSANTSNSDFDYCCSFNPAITLSGVNNISTNNPMFVNPATGDYSLQKGSLCIGQGHNPLYDDDLLNPGYNQNLITILDETQDIGAISYELDRYAEYSFTDDPQGNWMCFPVVDDYSVVNIGGFPYAANSMRAFFSQYETYQNSPMDAVGFTDYGPQGYDVYWHTPNFTKTNLIFGYKGYKALFNQNSTMNEFHGYQLPYSTPVPVPEPGKETWIGYFIPATQAPQVAFGSFMDELYFIQHKNWTLARLRPKRGDPWIATYQGGIGRPTLSYGDMVIVKKFGASDGYPELDEFTWTWWHKVREYTRPETEYFTYQKATSYEPVFVELDPLSTTKELAVMIDGVCYGAAVVDGNIIMIQAFIDHLPDGADMQIVAWDGAKSQGSPLTLKIYNPATDEFSSSASFMKQDCDFYYVKLGENNETESPELVSLSVSNYPNPFNPSTTISYSVPVNGDIRLEIYNAKGQLVNTLVNEYKEQGKYQIVWSGKDKNGNLVSSGIYFSRVASGGKSLTCKMLLMK